MADDKLTRREFVRTSAVAAAGMAAGIAPAYTVAAGNPDEADTSKILNYNPDMEYRRCGKTDWMVSAVALGGHWKRLNTVILGLFKGQSWLSAPIENEDFKKNRYEVVSRCIDRGINYIDANVMNENIAYGEALKGRRDKMYLGYSYYKHEPRYGWRTLPKLKQSFDDGLKKAGLDYVDLWRMGCPLHHGEELSAADIDGVCGALEWARKSGRARYTGISSHNRRETKKLIEAHSDVIQVVVVPYTSRTKVVTDRDGLWAALKKHDVGWFGIKPFASASLFDGDSSPGNPHEQQDNRLARLAIRYILCNPAITAPIPGCARVEEVDNVALAVKERRMLDLQEKAELDRATDRAWANLPHHYQWLKDWEYV